VFVSLQSRRRLKSKYTAALKLNPASDAYIARIQAGLRGPSVVPASLIINGFAPSVERRISRRDGRTMRSNVSQPCRSRLLKL
jgi:hypothetical protein